MSKEKRMLNSKLRRRITTNYTEIKRIMREQWTLICQPTGSPRDGQIHGNTRPTGSASRRQRKSEYVSTKEFESVMENFPAKLSRDANWRLSHSWHVNPGAKTCLDTQPYSYPKVNNSEIAVSSQAWQQQWFLSTILTF
jgi:hypothetical protein